MVQSTANSRPLLSLEIGVLLGVIHITNQTKCTPPTHISLQDIVQEYPTVFNGLGLHKTVKAKLIVDNDVTPIAQKPRKIPYNLETKVKEEERRLMELGIIEQVPDSEPTTWCTNPVVAPKPHKPGDIRYCSNMRVPNTAIKRPITEALTVDDVRVKLNNATVFSILDMNEAYHQLELEQSSRHLTTFYGTSTRLRYTRLNYGTISAQDIFDKAIDDTITGLNGVLHIRDDFIIFGRTESEHNAALRAFLTRFEECGLTLSPRKCKICVPEIEFFGLRFSKDGVSPSASKVEALRNMDRPKNASEVWSLLGMAQYSAQFIPGYAAMTTSLRMLTHNDIPWTWGETEETAFRDLTQSLSADSVLGYYQVGLETNLMVDAGPTGLGLLLLQKSDDRWKPIVCASRRLTETEQRYSQLEREALAIRWACERCYTYLIGSTFTVLSDHKPLESLMNNANSRPPMRIERWLMYLQQFDFTVKYIPGKINGADYLSRHAMPLSPKDRRSVTYREATVRQLVLSVVPRAVSLTEIQTTTAQDPQLMKLLPLLLSGDKEGVKADSTISQFHQVFDELSHAENVILRGSQIVVPTALQDRVLAICHEAHLGIVKSKQLLRSKVWFPGIDKKMEAKISGCIPCQAAIPRKQRDPLVMTELPALPWQNVAMDFCGPFPTGELVLVVIDERSRYPASEVVTSTSAKSTILALTKVFAIHGIPEKIKSDNGPPFRSEEFRRFCDEHGIQHQKISPLWPEANGLVENFMKSVGKIAKIAHSSGQDWVQQLFTFAGHYRAVPQPSTGKSPNKVLFGRELRNKLPQITTKDDDEEISVREVAVKEKQKSYADSNRHTQRHDLQPGDIVIARQQRMNKFSLPNDPVPYKVINTKGSMVSAEKLKGNKRLTRNSSHFKRIVLKSEDVNVDAPVSDDGAEDEEPDEIVLDAAPPDDMVADDVIANDVIADDVVVQHERRTRSGRAVKAPGWLDVYVHWSGVGGSLPPVSLLCCLKMSRFDIL